MRKKVKLGKKKVKIYINSKTKRIEGVTLKITQDDPIRDKTLL